jgi:hypothetical protein
MDLLMIKKIEHPADEEFAIEQWYRTTEQDFTSLYDKKNKNCG